MARTTSKSRSRRPAPPPTVHAPARSAGQATDPALAMNAQASQWARDALGASLLQTQGLFTLLQTLQQAQARALHDASADIERAIESLRAAEDVSAVAAVPGRFLQAQWQHAFENLGSIAGRLMEIEAAWLQQAQAQAAGPMAAMASGGHGQAERAAVASAAAADHGADQAAESWAQWVEDWQRGVDQIARTWADAVHAARPAG